MLKKLFKLLLFILAAILAGLLVARPVIAESPTIESSVINPPYGPKTTELQSILEKNSIRSNDKQLVRRSTSETHANTYDGVVYSKEEVIQFIKNYSQLYGINSLLPLRIANCESGYNQFSKNKSSTASGVFQYLSGTWRGTDEGKLGLSVFDADANVRAAIKYIASRGHAQPWASSQGCWSK